MLVTPEGAGGHPGGRISPADTVPGLPKAGVQSGITYIVYDPVHELNPWGARIKQVLPSGVILAPAAEGH